MKNWIFYVVLFVGAAAYHMTTSADRDASGAIVDGGNVDAFQLRLGDCIDDTSSLLGDGGGEVDTLPGVPCSEPHDNEVYAVFNVSFDSYPPEEEMFEQAFTSCHERFEPFVGKDYESSSLDILTLYPTEDSWNLNNDREVVCAVFDLNANKLTGSAKGTAL